MRTWIIACLAVLAMTATATAANVDLSITMTDAPDPVTAGQNVSYVITVSDATAVANNVKVVDTLPNGTQFVAANGTGWTCTTVSPINCTRATAAIGASPPITIIIQTPAAGGVLTNTATVSTTDTDTNAANNTATTTTTVKTSADLSITQTAAPSPVAAAGSLTYTINVTNAGPSPAAMAVVTDTLPSTATYVSAVGNNWTCDQAGGVVTCTQDPLAQGAADPITVIVTAPNEPQTLTNLVAISSATGDAVTANNSKSLDVNVVAGADLSIALGQDVAQVLVDGAVTYTATITNTGPSTAQSVTVTDTLPTDAIFISADGTGWTCTNAANVVTCTTTSLPIGTAPVISIMVTGPGDPQKVTNKATVASTTVDPLDTNNTAMLDTTILGSADLDIATTATATSLTGADITYVITVSNTGPSPAQSIRVIDTLPDDVTFKSATGLHWGCKDVAQIVTCDTTSLDDGVSAPEITIVVTAPPSGDSVTNMVTVDSSTHDPEMTNNVAMASSALDQIGLRGGSGCTAGGGASGVLVLVGIAFVLRRRRGAAALLTVAGALWAMPAHAQVAGGSESFPIDHMRLALDNDGILAVEFADVPKPGDWSAATFVGYSTKPLVAYNATTGQTIGELVKKRISGGLAVGVGITRWFEAGLELPMIYSQSRDDMAVPGVTTTLKSPRAGDLRLDPKFLILRGGEGRVGIAAIAGIGIPTGGDSGYAGDGGVTVSPEVVVSFGKKGFRASLDGGLLIRSTKEVAGLTIDDEIFARLGVAYRAPFGLELAAQLLSATSTSNVWSHKATDPTELDIGLSFATEGFSVFAVGGRGLQVGVGAPDLRFLAGIRVSPAADNHPIDRDGDGIPDAKDKCPTEPEDKDGFQDEDGCPDPDNDKDGISDEDDKCPNDPEDKDGFQDADGCPDPDNDQDGILDAKDKCPNEAEDKDGFQDEDGCPDLDNDNDGVPDAEDKCPNEPGPKETHGCPDRDSDADGIPDRLDTCPDEKGTEAFGGCAKKQLAMLRADRIELAAPLPLKGDRLDPKASATLDAVAKILATHQLIKVRVDGRGADSVVIYLVDKGADAARLGTNPATGGATEFILVDKIEAPKPPEVKPDEPKKPDEPDIEMEP